jgi:hypothetical protein
MIIMQSIKGYKLNTVEDVNLAMQQLNEYYGLPVENGISIFDERSYFKIENAYYLTEDKMLIPVLGEPIEITIPDF